MATTSTSSSSTTTKYDKIPVELPTNTLLTDAQIQEQANAYGDLTYGGALEEAKRAYDRGVAQQQQALEQYRLDYEQNQHKTQVNYAQQGNKISNQALSRGFARSTYVQDALRQNDVNMNSSLAEQTTAFQRQNAQINQQIDTLLAEYNDTSKRLTQERAKAIAQKVSELTQQRYENELQLKALEADLWKQQLAQQQFDAEMAFEREKFEWQKQQAAAAAARSYSGGGGGGGGKDDDDDRKPNPGATPDYEKLSGAALQQTQDQLAQQAYKLAQQRKKTGSGGGGMSNFAR